MTLSIHSDLASVLLTFELCTNLYHVFTSNEKVYSTMTVATTNVRTPITKTLPEQVKLD